MSYLEDSLCSQLKGLSTDSILKLVIKLVKIVRIVMFQLPICHLGYCVEWKQVHKFGIVNEDTYRHLGPLQKIDQRFWQTFLAIKSKILFKLFWFLFNSRNEMTFRVSEASNNKNFAHTSSRIIHNPLDNRQQRPRIRSLLAFLNTIHQIHKDFFNLLGIFGHINKVLSFLIHKIFMAHA